MRYSNKKRTGKKGATFDNFFVAISLFAFALVVLISLFMWNQLTTAALDDQIWDQSSIGPTVKQNAQNFYDDIDFWFIMIYLFVHLAVIITVFLLRSHPVVYIAGLFAIIILIYITVPLEAAWDEITADETFTTEIDTLRVTNRIMDNLTKLEMIWAFATLIIFTGFAKIEGFI